MAGAVRAHIERVCEHSLEERAKVALLYGHEDGGDEAGRLREDVLGKADDRHRTRLARGRVVELLEQVAHLKKGMEGVGRMAGAVRGPGRRRGGAP